MPAFLCDFLNEAVILSDGSITTCCLDPLGINTFANIYSDTLDAICKKYMQIREQVTRNVRAMPRCIICYDKLQLSGFPVTGTYTVNPSAAEIDGFLHHESSHISQLVIELTSKCNLRCNGCMQSRVNFKEYRKTSFLDVPYLQEWLKTGLLQIKNIRLYNYGETFLHRDALNFCSFVKKESPETSLDIASNGMLLNTPAKRLQLVESGVDSISFSIHGASQKTVQQYMTEKFDFDFMLEIMRDIEAVKLKLGRKTPRIYWKYILFEWNDSDQEINNARALAEELGIAPVQFALVGYPSPSRRFALGGKDFQDLINSHKHSVATSR